MQYLSITLLPLQALPIRMSTVPNYTSLYHFSSLILSSQVSMYFHKFSCLDITLYGYNMKNPEKTNIK